MNLLKILAFLPLLLAFVLLSTPKTYAATGPFGACGTGTVINTSTVCKDANGPKANSNSNPVISIIKTAILIISILIGIASVITIMVSGFRLVMSEGKAENISSARSAIIFAVVGLIIAASAQLVVVFILDKLK